MSDDNLRTAYQELCTSYRAIDEFRLKLLGFLPFATGVGVVLLSDALTDDKKREFATQFLKPIGIFGFAITLGLLFYELYGIKKCHRLIEVGKQLEGRLVDKGQFISRPREAFGVINEPFAAGVIYPAVLAAWMYLIRWSASPQTALSTATWVFASGFAFIVVFSILLKRDVWWV